VTLSDDGGGTVVVDPRTLTPYHLDCCGVADVVGGFGSDWSLDVEKGSVQRWDPSTYGLEQSITVTDAPLYEGSCMTSIAASGDAVWVTLAPARNHACNF
jgi:hypothetical protein